MTLLRNWRSLFRRRRDDAHEQPIFDSSPRQDSGLSEAHSTDCKEERERHAAK